MKLVSLIGTWPSGAYQVHLTLLRGLERHGCSITWLTSGTLEARINQAGGFEVSPGELVAPHTDDRFIRTRAMVDKVREIAPAAILCHALGEKINFNAIRYLPESIPKILILHNTAVADYRAARAVRDYVSATVAISRRVQEDLVASYGFRGHRIEYIPNGIDVAAYSSCISTGHRAGRVRILVHGRINHGQKGVLWVPEILARLAHRSGNWECTVSGSGGDLEKLKQQVAAKGLSEQVKFVGWTAHEDVPGLMSAHDILLFPSKYEGFGIALVEAMAGGCVPVASRLHGVTDSIIQDGVDGLLFPIGNADGAARLLYDLIDDPGRLAAFGQRARESGLRNSLESMCSKYHDLICEVMKSPTQVSPAEDIDSCELAPDLRPAWWNYLPNPLKDRLRVVRENVRAVVRVP